MSKKDTCGECRGYKDRTKCPRWRVPRPDDPACLNFVLKSPSPAVEPEDTDATIYKGCKNIDERTIVKLAYALAETNATIRKLRVERLDLRVERDGIDQKCWEVEHELAEAKEEIENWRKSAQVYRDRYILALNDRDVAQAELEIKNEDAEIGRMVLGMRPYSRLTRWYSEYSVETAKNYEWGRAGSPMSGSAADALRAIQEVGDACDISHC